MPLGNPKLAKTAMGEVSIRSSGTGLPVLFWSSILVDGDMWSDVVTALPHNVQAIVIDPPGHGESAPIKSRFSIDQCGDALVEIMDALEIENAVIAGNSWGGMVTLNVGARFPQRCLGLVVMNSSARRATFQHIVENGLMPFIVRLFGIIPPMPAIAAFSFLGVTARRTRPDLKAFVSNKLLRMDRMSAVATVNSILLYRADQRPLLGRITAPTLIIGGGEDRVFSKMQQDEIHKGIVGSRLLMLPKAGHFAPLEAAQEVADALSNFFGEIRTQKAAA